MIKIYPFPALRAASEYASKVAATCTGIESNSELLKELEDNPFSYLHIVKPHLHFNDEVKNAKVHYPFAKNYFRQMMEQDVIHKVPQNSMYIYTQISADGDTFDGIVTGISFLNYLEGDIKKHENTLAEKEERLMNHVQSLGAVAEPVLLACEDRLDLANWIKQNKKSPVFDFTMKDQGRHILYELVEPKQINQVQKIFDSIKKLYIADGHHRIAATTSYCTRLFTTQNKSVEDLLFMAYIIPESQLKIKSFHRVVKNIDARLIDKLISNKQSAYSIESIDTPLIPSSKGKIGMYYNGQWYQISVNNSNTSRLDVQFLDAEIFNSLLGIEDTRLDTRISYLRGDIPLQEIQSDVDHGTYTLAFTLFANTMDEIKSIADKHETMPPKSTWIEPKLPVGMIIQRF